jgi:hypothetical protein
LTPGKLSLRDFRIQRVEVPGASNPILAKIDLEAVLVKTGMGDLTNCSVAFTFGDLTGSPVTERDAGWRAPEGEYQELKLLHFELRSGSNDPDIARVRVACDGMISEWHTVGPITVVKKKDGVSLTLPP